MNKLSPEKAANLALDVYGVRSPLLLKAFLAKNDFSAGSKQNNVLKAELGSRLINTRDQFGVCVRGAGTYSNDLFVIFRGTDITADMITDARMGLNVSATGSMVHSGFNQAFNSLRQELGKFIDAQSKVATVHCIGHSLGGAVANLAADWISKTYKAKVQLYTFGAPRVGFGMTGFAATLTKKLGGENIHRVYHNSDPVPMVPLFPYFHAPTSEHSYFIQYNSSIITPSAHKMNNYINSVKENSWSILYRPEPKMSFSSVKQWLKQDNRENVNDSTFWNKLNTAMAFIAKSVLSAALLPVVGGLTIADYLAMILRKGIQMAGEVASWVFYLVRKLMKMLGMKVAETAKDLTEQLLRMVLNRVTQKIYEQAKRAFNQMR